MRKWRVPLAFALLVGVTVTAVAWRPSISTNINIDGFQRIAVGMTRGQVEEVLGVPAGNYNTRAVRRNTYT